jgi:hypothetical protein
MCASRLSSLLMGKGNGQPAALLTAEKASLTKRRLCCCRLQTRACVMGQGQRGCMFLSLMLLSQWTATGSGSGYSICMMPMAACMASMDGQPSKPRGTHRCWAQVLLPRPGPCGSGLWAYALVVAGPRRAWAPAHMLARGTVVPLLCSVPEGSECQKVPTGPGLRMFA